MAPSFRTHLKDHNSFLYQDVPSPLPSNGMLPTHEEADKQMEHFKELSRRRMPASRPRTTIARTRFRCWRRRERSSEMFFLSLFILFGYFCLLSAIDMKEISLFLFSKCFILTSFCFGHGNCLYL